MIHMNHPRIDVTRSSLPSYEEYIEEIKDLWETKWLTNMGSKHQQLEQELMRYLNTSNISLFANGHLALENAFAALKLGGEVITTPFTFASTTHAIVRSGLTPVFCDINYEDYTMDTGQLEDLITEKTCAIVPVHVYGNICNVKEIGRIAEKYNLKVIYDAAHAFGVVMNGVNAANFGDASIFSFHATKVFNTIEGGAITFGDESLKGILESIKNFGINGIERVEHVGGNAKMNEFQAAMGLCNLRIVDQEIAKRKRVYERYLEQLEGIGALKLPRIKNGIQSNYAYFPIVFEKESIIRDTIYQVLRDHHIFARKYFYPLTNEFDCYRGKVNPGETPISQYIANRVLTLPLFADLRLEEVDRITSIIKNELKILS